VGIRYTTIYTVSDTTTNNHLDFEPGDLLVYIGRGAIATRPPTNSVALLVRKRKSDNSHHHLVHEYEFLHGGNLYVIESGFPELHFARPTTRGVLDELVGHHQKEST
jgi:hypothetical protein